MWHRSKAGRSVGELRAYKLFWAITKNGYTRSVWSQKRVQSGIKSKIHSTSHAIGQKQIVPVFQRLWPGYTCKWLLCSVLYLVVYGLGRYFLLVFGLYLLFKFSLRVSFHSIQPFMRTCLRRSIYSYVQIMHVSLRLLYYQVLEVSLCG